MDRVDYGYFKQKDMTHYRRLVELLKNEIQKRLQLCRFFGRVGKKENIC